MKIVMLCDAFFDGLQYQENLLSKYYTKHGHSVTIIASNFDNIFDYYAENYKKNNTIVDEIINNIRIIKLPFKYNILNKLRKLKNVHKYLDEIRPDLIYVHDIHLNIEEAAAYKKKNSSCKIIMDYHADYSNSGKNWISINILHKIIRKYFFNKAKKFIDKIYYVVPSSGVFLNEVYKIPYNKMSLLPLGVDTDLVNKTKQSNQRDEIRRKFGIPKDSKVIFSGGKISKNKRTHLIIETLRNLNNKNFHLLLVGTFGKDDTEYESYVRNLSANLNNIHFAGWVSGDEVYHYMAACDIAVFPASQTVLWQQSLAMSLPLVIGEEYINSDGKSFLQDVDYLNLYDNIKIIRKGKLSADTLGQSIKYFLDSCRLDEHKENASLVATEMLDYNSIILETLNFQK